MGVLPRPDLPPGPRRDLIEALHSLHHRAGWPSLRVLAREAGCSPTTVSVVFSSPRLPTWGLLELLVEAMDGDVEAFRALWQAAGSTVGSPVKAFAASAQIAGRVSELGTVRRHLTSGEPGLLLATGEAGIGKTRLVNAAHLGDDAVIVAQGCCLPLSTEVPMLPIAEVLRSILERDEGQLLKAALADCPRYVPGALAPLLPELGELSEPGLVPNAGERQRQFAAVRATLAALGTQGACAVVIEDLNWADPATLDLLENLLVVPRGLGLPVVGTYRTDDPATPPATTDWFLRVQRLPSVSIVEVRALDRKETEEQLRLLGHRTDPGLVERIHRRAEGHPLFIEQLAAHSSSDQRLPTRLADLLERRLDGLSVSARLTVRTLGIADRQLDTAPLAEATGLGHTGLIVSLHELDERRLLRTRSNTREAELRHPLLAEAIRRRLVPGEAAEVHRALALALAGSSDASAAEIAAHWHGGGNDAEELAWTVRAARAAEARYANHESTALWLRALGLWRNAKETLDVETPPLRKIEAYITTLEALALARRESDVRLLGDRALAELEELTPVETADLLRLSANVGSNASPEERHDGLARVEQAISIYRTRPPTVALADALELKTSLLISRGEYAAAAAAVRETDQVLDLMPESVQSVHCGPSQP